MATKPRRHIPGQVSLLTRRTIMRLFMLKPDEFMNAVMSYEVARASHRHGQSVHAAMTMPNHPHFVVTDTTGERSGFMQDAMSGIARVRNRDLDRSGYFWDAQPYGDTVLLDQNAIERKLLYTWLNPVKAGLVPRAKDWPGFKVLPKDWGKTITVKCPDRFYGRDSPDTVQYTPQPPPGYDHMSLEEVQEHFEELLRKEEDKIIEARKVANTPFFGLEYIQAINHYGAPKSSSDSGQLNPRFATTDAKVMANAIERYKNFLEAYEATRQRWKKGKRKCVFPCGTLWLRKNANVKCAPVGTDEPGLVSCS